MDQQMKIKKFSVRNKAWGLQDNNNKGKDRKRSVQTKQLEELKDSLRRIG